MVRLLLVFAVAVFALLIGGSAPLPSGAACDAACQDESLATTLSAAVGTLLATGSLGGLLVIGRGLRR